MAIARRQRQQVDRARASTTVPFVCPSHQSPADMLWLLALIGLFSLLWGLFKEASAVSDFWSQQEREGEWVDVLNRFIFCDSKDQAYKQAKDKGRGAEPLFHAPHRPGNPDHYYHYHVGNHELLFEDGYFVNCHWVFEDEDHPRGGRGFRGRTRSRFWSRG